MRPVILAAPDPGPFDDVLESVAGVVLLGGGDIDPARYREVARPEVYGVEPERDALELELVGAALASGLPLLAICRGAQLLNVTMGGTLVQHLPAVPGVGPHGRPERDGAPAVHEVHVAPGSHLAAALGGATVLPGCTSIHHQAADRVAPGLTVTARSSDGVVEALEPTEGWVLAVQWHPERTAATDPRQQAIFDAFAGAVKQRLLIG